MTTNKSNHEQSVGLWAGTLAVTELGLGSLLLSMWAVAQPAMLWISLGLLVGLSYFLDSEWVPAVWIGMRSLAAIYILYAVLRLMPWTKILNSQNRNATALRAALNVINQKSATDSQPLQKSTDDLTSCTASPVLTYSAELK